MREILFRGKRPSSDKWIYGFFWKDEAYCYILDGIVDYIVTPETICQYTGRKDTNGIKIFEGDIVRFNEWSRGPRCWIGAVEYDYGSMFVVRGDPNEECLTKFEKQLSGISEDRIEVIGNIYYNPELLEKK